MAETMGALAEVPGLLAEGKRSIVEGTKRNWREAGELRQTDEQRQEWDR